MNAKITPLIIFCAFAVVASSPSALAQRQLGKKKGPTSKIYIAEAKGETQIQTNDKVYIGRQATAFDAPGTIIETKADSSNTFVYSNGTGMFVDQNSRIEINRFVQEPFKSQRETSADTLLEPSISQSDVFVARGAVGICTSQLVSGSSMNYSTPQGSVNIRGGKVSLTTDANETVIDLLEGDITVRGSGKDVGGQILRAGERAVIRPGAAGQPPSVTIAPIPPEAMQAADERVSSACNARKTVTFEVIEQRAGVGLDAPADDGTDSGAAAQEFVVKATVPASPPVIIVISPDRLPGG